MNDDVPRTAELDALLSRARKAGPPRARLDAVRARLESELGPLAPNDAAAPAPSREAAPAQTQPPAAPSWLAPAGLAALLALGLVAFLAVRSDPERPSPGLLEEPSALTPTSSATGSAEAPGAVPVEGATAAEPRAAPEVTVPASPPAEAPRPRTPRAERAPVPDDTAPEPVDDPGSSLREEVVLLERAMSRRRAGDPSGARAVLAEHARRFPQGHLAPERDRLTSELGAEASEGP